MLLSSENPEFWGYQKIGHYMSVGLGCSTEYWTAYPGGQPLSEVPKNNPGKQQVEKKQKRVKCLQSQDRAAG